MTILNGIILILKYMKMAMWEANDNDSNQQW